MFGKRIFWVINKNKGLISYEQWINYLICKGGFEPGLTGLQTDLQDLQIFEPSFLSPSSLLIFLCERYIME
jgi:hypothetical protein